VLIFVFPRGLRRYAANPHYKAEVKRKRQDDTRRKVLAGAVLLANVENGTWPEAELKAMMDKALTRNDDRQLFGLAALEIEATTPASE